MTIFYIQRMPYLIFRFLLLFFFIPSLALAQTNNTSDQPKIGNFAVPSAQQPGSFFSFGQNIVDKGDFVLIPTLDYQRGTNTYNTEAMGQALYGFSDSASIIATLPYSLKAKNGNNYSSGIEDVSVQLEYAFINNNTKEYSQQATVVGAAYFPTGSLNKNPATGFGSRSYFAGFTWSRIYVEWFGFTSYGAQLTTQRHGNKIGNQYYYQIGIGKNLFYQTDSFIFAIELEMDGTYQERNKMSGSIDPNSGGNIILLGPSLWFSTPKTIFQIGIQYAAAQHQNGIQPRTQYFAAAQFRYTF